MLNRNRLQPIHKPNEPLPEIDQSQIPPVGGVRPKIQVLIHTSRRYERFIRVAIDEDVRGR